MIVDKVQLTVVENEVVSVVYGFMNGKKVSFTGRDEHTFAGLKRGDIIRTKYNYGAQAVGYQLVHTYGNEDDVTAISDYTNISNNSYRNIFPKQSYEMPNSDKLNFDEINDKLCNAIINNKLNNPIINPNTTAYLIFIKVIAIDKIVPTKIASNICPTIYVENIEFVLL